MQTIIVIWLLLGIVNAIKTILSSWYQPIYNEMKLKVLAMLGFYPAWFDLIPLLVVIIGGPYFLLKDFVNLFRK